MRLVITRVSDAKCVVDNKEVSSIKNGLLILQGFQKNDSNANFPKIIDKLSKLRIFEDENGKLNKSITDINGEILLISQFTLYADLSSGNRPSFFKALEYNLASVLYEEFKTELNKKIPTKGGVFGADMEIISNNKGPVTIILDEEELYGEKD